MSNGYVEPEGLYPTYRQELTKKISHLCKTGEGFRVPAESGMGKSKYFRYITTSKTIKAQYFSNVTLYYLDLNRVYTNTTEQLIKCICKILGCKNSTGEGIEKKINLDLSKSDKVYIILDQAENLNEFDKQAVRFLRSLRDTNKGKLAFVLSYEKETGLNKTNLNYLLEISPIEVSFGPLKKEESIVTTINLAKNLNMQITDTEVEQVVTVVKGYPRIIRQILTQKLSGISIKDAILSIQKPVESQRSVLNKEGNSIDTIEKNMTKNEQIVLKEMLKSNGAVVKRDELAVLLSPESQGGGVSNEAIDQIVSRIRKALKKLKLPYSVVTARGIGYYVETNPN